MNPIEAMYCEAKKVLTCTIIPYGQKIQRYVMLIHALSSILDISIPNVPLHQQSQCIF